MPCPIGGLLPYGGFDQPVKYVVFQLAADVLGAVFAADEVAVGVVMVTDAFVFVYAVARPYPAGRGVFRQGVACGVVGVGLCRILGCVPGFKEAAERVVAVAGLTVVPVLALGQLAAFVVTVVPLPPYAA